MGLGGWCSWREGSLQAWLSSRQSLTLLAKQEPSFPRSHWLQGDDGQLYLFLFGFRVSNSWAHVISCFNLPRGWASGHVPLQLAGDSLTKYPQEEEHGVDGSGSGFVTSAHGRYLYMNENG